MRFGAGKASSHRHEGRIACGFAVSFPPKSEVLGHVHTLGTNVNKPFFSKTHPTVPEYKVETLYSGTEVGVNILGTQYLKTAPFCAGARAPSVNIAIESASSKGANLCMQEWD